MRALVGYDVLYISSKAVLCYQFKDDGKLPRHWILLLASLRYLIRY
jgi:hypothetical protein